MDGVITSGNGEDSVQVFASGTVTARSDTEARARRLMQWTEILIRRVLECTGCGLCAAKCRDKAIRISQGRAVVRYLGDR